MFRFTRRARSRASTHEQAKMERLERAEADLQALQERGAKAIKALDERHQRNHWREAIEQMIQGVV